MDAAALRQCLCNAGSPGFSQFSVLMMHFMASFFAKGAVAVACVLCTINAQKRRESIFRLFDQCAECADNATRNASEQQLKAHFAADPASHLV